MGTIFGIVADDFSGACDVGVQFKKHGLGTTVLRRTERLHILKGISEVVVIDTETRNVAPQTAYKKVKDAVGALKKADVALIFKKIDSTLRGNLGAEIDALMDEQDLEAVIVAPAFPAQGRTTLGGRMYVAGLPLEESEFARDTLNTVRKPCIATLIQRQTKRRIGHADLSKVRSGAESLKENVQRMIEGGNEIVVADAETQSDLATIAEASIGLKVLLCGSAGLADESSRLLASKTQKPLLLVVCGSVNNVSLRQIVTAEKELNIVVHEPRLHRLVTSEVEHKSEVDDLVRSTEKSIEAGRDVVIRLTDSKLKLFEMQELGKTLGLNVLQIADRLLSALGEASKSLIQRHGFGAIVLMGGDTASNVMDALDADGVEIEREILPGISFSRVLGGNHEALQVVTKAGGFGDDYTLVGIMRYLKRGELE